MGHASEKTTRIYLDSLESSVIDRANRDIIEALNEKNLKFEEDKDCGLSD